jgi:hypothetical protein
MLVTTRLRHVTSTKWGTKRYLQMNRLTRVVAFVRAFGLLAPMGASRPLQPQPTTFLNSKGRSKVRKILDTTSGRAEPDIAANLTLG